MFFMVNYLRLSESKVLNIKAETKIYEYLIMKMIIYMDNTCNRPKISCQVRTNG